MPGASLTTDMSFHVSPSESCSNPKCLSYARESGRHLHQRQVAGDSVPVSHRSVCFLKPLLVLTNCHRLVRWEANSEIRLLCRMFIREKSEEPHSWKGGERSRPGQEKLSSWDTASIKASGDSLARMEQNGLLQLPQLVLCEPLLWVWPTLERVGDLRQGGSFQHKHFDLCGLSCGSTSGSWGMFFLEGVWASLLCAPHPRPISWPPVPACLSADSFLWIDLPISMILNFLKSKNPKKG